MTTNQIKFVVLGVLLCLLMWWLLGDVQGAPKRPHRYIMARSGLASFHRPLDGFTCAARGVHRGSILLVTANGKSRRVTVRDSGPYVRGRVLDLSDEAFRWFYGSLRKGVGKVRYRVVKRGRGAWCGRI